MNMDELEPQDLAYLYPDFLDCNHGCRYNGCVHDQNGCRVKEAVSDGMISEGQLPEICKNTKRTKGA